jgi:nucleoside-diphosphate-sugar epimerase
MDRRDLKAPCVLITGSEGLIGDRAVRSFAEHYDVASFDIERPNKLADLQDFIHCDLTSDESVQKALEAVALRHGNSLASIVHLAAYYDFSGKPSRLYKDLTVEGTRRLLRGLQSFDVDQFVFSSTLLAMKPSQDGELLDEDSPLEAEWDYPKSKLEAENVIAGERDGIPAVSLRIAGVYDEDCHSIPIAHQISRIYERRLESFVFPGDTSTGQAFVHLDDLVECIARVIERRRELDEFEVFLVAEPDVMSYDELQDAIGEMLYGRDWPTIRIPKAVAKAGAWVKEKIGDEEEFIKPWMIDLADHHYPVSIEKARRKLGWEPKRRLRTTLPEMIRRLKEDPVRWYQENGLEVPEMLKQGVS